MDDNERRRIELNIQSWEQRRDQRLEEVTQLERIHGPLRKRGFWSFLFGKPQSEAEVRARQRIQILAGQIDEAEGHIARFKDRLR